MSKQAKWGHGEGLLCLLNELHSEWDMERGKVHRFRERVQDVGRDAAVFADVWAAVDHCSWCIAFLGPPLQSRSTCWRRLDLSAGANCSRRAGISYFGEGPDLVSPYDSIHHHSSSIQWSLVPRCFMEKPCCPVL